MHMPSRSVHVHYTCARTHTWTRDCVSKECHVWCRSDKNDRKQVRNGFRALGHAFVCTRWLGIGVTRSRWAPDGEAIAIFWAATPVQWQSDQHWYRVAEPASRSASSRQPLQVEMSSDGKLEYTHFQPRPRPGPSGPADRVSTSHPVGRDIWTTDGGVKARPSYR